MLYRTLSAPITCQIELTSACNNNCIHCYNHWRHGENNIIYSLDKSKIDTILNEIIENKIFQVTFTGGETFLKRDLLFYGIEKLLKSDIGCSVNSNLTTFTKEDGRILYSLGLRGILTSLCSFDESTHDYIVQRKGAFNETLKGIKNAQKVGLNVACSMVITNLNVDHVINTGLFLKKIGVSMFYATKASPPVNDVAFNKHLISKENLLKVLNELHNLKENEKMDVGILECYPLCSYKNTSKFDFVASRRCSAGTTTCTIGAAGDIRPCSHSDEVYGNVFTGGLKKSWFAMEMYRDGSMLPKDCQNCKYLYKCSGGCRIDAKYHSGHYASLDPFADNKNINMISVIDAPLKPVYDTSVFEVNRNLKIRQEKFGVLVANQRNVGSPSLLTNDTYQFLLFMKDKKFTTEEITEQFNLPLDASKKICSLLTRDKILNHVLCKESDKMNSSLKLGD